MPATLAKLTYQALQKGKGAFSLAHKEISLRLLKAMAPDAVVKTLPLDSGAVQALRGAMDALLERDWQDGEDGIYPTELLFSGPWKDWAVRYPLLWLDSPATWNRLRRRDFHDLPTTINRQHYPTYYLRNFHNQTDGYLSDRSAALYDLQVEILFNGAADPMRRRLLRPLKQALPRSGTGGDPSRPRRILDLATGTGRTMHQLRAAFPRIQLVGCDLSEAYLRQAGRWLAERPGELPQLVQANVEAVPFVDRWFDAVTCVFLLHELPRSARANCMKEAFRLLKPGGVLAVLDSVQPKDSPQFKVLLDNFRRVYHEPFYGDYTADSIENHLDRAGFELLLGETHFLSRLWLARKPS
ncbi:MAG: methyltransferase [Candidatus Synechococcus spongiarum 15L]|uniref:Methyltransferase n=1 Tax=Candidatus Synechococcus spongiarum 15L TaxID=1608419 RepID=A0A0G8AT54_9SYNE|nr:MAG: methyltransferase [Candidatus Synechococcus spongiarum 15L]